MGGALHHNQEIFRIVEDGLLLRWAGKVTSEMDGARRRVDAGERFGAALAWIPDRDGDDIPDSEPEVILDGFTVANSNYHNLANGLRWGPDGWLYGRCGGSCPGNVGAPGTLDEERVPLRGGIWRYHPKRKFFEVVVHGTTNPWGHDWDQNGEGFFINTVNGHLWHMIPGGHFDRPFGRSINPLVYEEIQMHEHRDELITLMQQQQQEDT